MQERDGFSFIREAAKRGKHPWEALLEDQPGVEPVENPPFAWVAMTVILAGLVVWSVWPHG